MINKINVDGKEYKVGGNNTAKLVAKGNWNSEKDVFILNNKLDGSKLYCVIFHIASYGSSFNTFILTNEIWLEGEGFGNVTAIGEFPAMSLTIDEEYVSGYVTYIRSDIDNTNYIILEPYGEYEKYQYQDDYDYCEVYELPITFGGNE